MTYYTQQYKKVDSARLRYLLDREKSLMDFTNRMQDKRMDKLKMPSGLYSFTYLWLDYMAINDNLQPEQDYETQCHEAGHTEWEYGTRINTKWKLDIDEEELRKKIINNFNYN